MTIHMDILVPDFAESISEGTVGQWKKNVGDKVKVGETILDVETDKTSIDVTATRDGVIEKLLKQTGDVVGRRDVLGVIAVSPALDDLPENPTSEQNAAENLIPDAGFEQREARSEGVETEPESQERYVTPVASRLAQSMGVDISQVKGTGPDGRVLKQDVERVAESTHTDTGQAAQTSLNNEEALGPEDENKITAGENENVIEPKKSPRYPDTEYEGMPKVELQGPDDIRRVPLTRRQLTMANRLAEVQREAVMTTTYNEVDMTNISLMRSRYGEKFEKNNGIRLGLLSFFVKAAVAALDEFPIFNAELQKNEIVYYRRKHIGIAVATKDGLVVPVLRDVTNRSFASIESEIRTMAARAREKTLSMEDLTGGTFTITNGGVFGSLFSTPILNPPQTGILGMHATRKRPIAVGDAIEIHPMMYLALTYDHRVVEGAVAVQFLKRICLSVEDPSRMLLNV